MALMTKKLPYTFDSAPEEGEEEEEEDELERLFGCGSLKRMSAKLGLIIGNDDDLSLILKNRCPIRMGKLASNENNTIEIMAHLNERFPVKHLHLP